MYTGDPDYEKIIEGKEITWLAESIQNNLDEKMIVAQSSATVTDSQEGQEPTVVEVRELGIASSIWYGLLTVESLHIAVYRTLASGELCCSLLGFPVLGAPENAEVVAGTKG